MAGTKSLSLAFLGAPIMWALHLAVSYFLVGLGCETGWGGAEAAILLATVVCAIAAAGAGLFAWRWLRSTPQHETTPALDTDQVPMFLAISGALLATLFTGAIILSGMVPLFLPLCSPS